MNVRISMWILLFIVCFYFIAQLFGWLPVVQSVISSLPVWSYFVLAGIVFSGYKVFQGFKEEYQINQSHIEQEGQVYMMRIEEERKKREQA